MSARLVLLSPDGPATGSPADVVELSYAEGADGADWIAGELVRSCVNYEIRLALVGDISARVAASQALDAFVRESNRGRHVWFADEAELRSTLR